MTLTLLASREIRRFNSFFFFLQNPTHSFINRPSQTAYRRNGVHELVLGPKLSIGDLGLPQIPAETEFYIVDWKKSIVETVKKLAVKLDIGS